MSRSSIFSQVSRALSIARFCERARISTSEGLERAAEVAHLRRKQREVLAAEHRSRRAFLKGAAGIAGGAALGSFGGRAAAKPSSPASVAVVGAGLAGLVCADTLELGGVTPTLYDASARVGGRCFSLGGAFGGPVTFPGQVVERGGEFVDNLHKTMLGYAQEFDLDIEDVNKEPGEIFYFLDGELVPESDVVDEFRALVEAMHDDLNASTGAPTADSHNTADIDLDHTSLAEYLETRGAGPIAYKAIDAAYLAEYGREIDEQSCLNFLLYIHADKRSKFTPFGVFSDERWHLVGGNQQIAHGIRDRLSRPVAGGHRLTAMRLTNSGRVSLTFERGSSTVTVTHDAVVIALPFTVLRGVSLHPSLGLPSWKVAAIQELGYGDNAKTMIGFNGAYWKALGSNGTAYTTSLPNCQTTWETSPTTATASRAVLTDYAGGARGLALSAGSVQQQAAQFLADLEHVYPGANAAATRVSGNKLLAHVEAWPHNPLTLGSYTCYLPGQFTTISGNEGKRVGHVHFAGEHANSFYEWQGFMEGACLSGIQAANEILQDIKVGAL